ncbi:MAG: hypothetical protein CMB22_01465 [Euryarchaeota archaeon]|nr:hypothetical protein [Euryarchaeota archaeon]
MVRPGRTRMAWDAESITGPDGQDWRVPVSELESRQNALSLALASEGLESILIDDPVELYWLTGGRQNSMLLVGSEGSGIETKHWVRRSLKRAIFESGGDDSPHESEKQPRMANLSEALASVGCTERPSMLSGKIPHDRWSFLNSKMTGLTGESRDGTGILYSLREVKSNWEIQMHRESGEVNRRMFEAVSEIGMEGCTELELAAAADSVSREAGFGGRIRMRRWPMDCDRVVVAAGRSGSVPSYFDSAIGGLGASPISSLGAGFAKVKKGEPVLVDIVHLHRGYVSDCTRMFSLGGLSVEWTSRLDDMVEIKNKVVGLLGKGEDCSSAWLSGSEMASEMGHSGNLMGMHPNQSSFLGHSVGLELDETPVVALGFDRELKAGGTMAVEPKVIHEDGAIGNEDTWVRTSEGMECLTAGSSLPNLMEW